MKKALSLILALVMCLSLYACSENTPTATNGSAPDNDTTGTSVPATPNSTQTQPLADFDILGEWIIADDGLAVITFNEDGTCSRDGEVAVKYKVEADIAVLTIYYATPQSYNIEKVDEHYRITGKHFLFRDDESAAIQMIAEKQRKYDEAFELLKPYLTYADHPAYALSVSGYDNIATAYTLLVELGDYKDAMLHLQSFVCLEDVLLCDGECNYAYDTHGLQVSTYNSSFLMENYYNENGYLVKTERYTTSDFSQPSAVVSYTNNESGLPTYSKLVGQSGSVSESVWEYDEYGNEVKSGYLPNDRFPDNELQTFENVYNDQGQLVEKYSSDGDIWYYSYNAEGHLIEETCGRMYDEFTIFSKDQYSYESGKIVEHTYISYYRGAERDRTVYKYTYGTFYWYIAPEA